MSGLDTTPTTPPRAQPRSPRSLRARYGLRQEEMSSLLGVSLRTVSTLERGGKRSPHLRRRIAEVTRLLAALGEMMDERRVGAWLGTPHESFGGLTPLEIVERGEVDRVWQLALD